MNAEKIVVDNLIANDNEIIGDGAVNNNTYIYIFNFFHLKLFTILK